MGLCFFACHQEAGRDKPGPTRDFQAAEYYNYYGPRDSAFYYYNRVISNSKDTLEKATAWFKMGLSLLDAGDYFSAQENLLSSIRILDEADSAHVYYLAADYNTLANATLELKDYEAAIRNYRLAQRFVPRGDPQLYVLNNLGVTYQKQGDYRRALQVFDSAIHQPTADTALKAKLISNRARTQWLQDASYPARTELLQALALRQQINDSNGINSSFAHLTDYYTRTHPDSALYYANQRWTFASRLSDPNNRLEALGQLARLSPPEASKQYMAEYIRFDDSVSAVRSRDRNQYGLIKFDAEKTRADNRVLQQRVVTQRLVIAGTAFLALLVIFFLVVRARARRRLLAQQAETAIRESKLKTSQKVHDVVANGLYRIMNELEHKEELDKEELLNKIEGLYEQSRDISYEEVPRQRKQGPEQVRQLVDAFSDPDTRVILVGNEPAFWSGMGAEAKAQVHLVLEELLVNMRKHSGAASVVLQFEQEGSEGRILYKDDGVGLPAVPHFGNGLNNTVNRIQAIGGEISFDRRQPKGLAITIRFPIHA